MISNSLIFKATTYPEWFGLLNSSSIYLTNAFYCGRFGDRIQPWVHYIPISYDYSDLHDAFIFFRGDIAGEGNHDELAKKIALAGSKWASTFWREEDATAYMYRYALNKLPLVYIILMLRQIVTGVCKGNQPRS